MIVRSPVFTLRSALKLLSLTAFVAGITKIKIKQLKFNIRPKNNYLNRKIIMHIYHNVKMIVLMNIIQPTSLLITELTFLANELLYRDFINTMGKYNYLRTKNF